MLPPAPQNHHWKMRVYGALAYYVPTRVVAPPERGHGYKEPWLFLHIQLGFFASGKSISAYFKKKMDHIK